MKNLLADKNIQVIFSLTENTAQNKDVITFYNNVKSILGQGTQVVVSGKDNLKDTLINAYKEMIKRVTLEYTGIPEDYEVSVTTICNGKESISNICKWEDFVEFWHGKKFYLQKDYQILFIDPILPESNDQIDTDKTKVTFNVDIKLPVGKCPKTVEAKFKTPGYAVLLNDL